MAFNIQNLLKTPKLKVPTGTKQPARFVFGSPRQTRYSASQKENRHGFDQPKKLGDYFT